MEKKDKLVYSNKKLKTFEISTNEPRKLETRVIEYEGEGHNLQIASMTHITLPFFTKRRNKRDINLLYDIKFLGLEMEITLDSSSKRQVQQPAELEEKIYDFLLQKLYKNYKLSKTKDAPNFIRETPIIFSLKDILEGLNLNYSNSYSTKINKALTNLKYTTYIFTQTNKQKSDKKYLKFEHQRFSLINYEKLKEGRNIYYKVWLNNPIAIEAFEKNLIMHFTDDSIKKLSNNNVIERIYKFISMNRFSDNKGEASLIELACVVPYELKSKFKKNGKEYIKDLTPQVMKKITSHFEKIVEIGYLKKFKTKGKESISYTFNDKELGLVSNHSLEEFYKINKIKQNRIDAKNIVETEILEVKVIEDDIDELIKIAIIKAKENKFVSKYWNKRVDNKIKKITKEEGKEYTIKILNKLEISLKEDVSSLVQYINGIMKKNSVENILPIKKKREKTPKSEIITIEAEKKALKNNEPDYYTIFEGLPSFVQEGIVNEAEKKYLIDLNIEKMTTKHTKLFTKSVKKSYIIKILRG